MSKTTKTKSFGAKPRISKEAVERAFLDWLMGASLRDLPKRYGFHHNTFWYQFRKLYGENYSSIPRSKGVVAIIKEYLNDKKLSNKDRNAINDFLESNKEMLIQTDLANTATNLYTEKQLRNMTWAECSHTENDYKTIFESCIVDEQNRFDDCIELEYYFNGECIEDDEDESYYY